VNPATSDDHRTVGVCGAVRHRGHPRGARIVAPHLPVQFVNSQLDDRETLILRAVVIVAWTITIAALYFGFLAVRRLLGYEPLPELVPVSAVIAIGVLLIPAFLDYIVERVARVPWDGA